MNVHAYRHHAHQDTHTSYTGRSVNKGRTAKSSANFTIKQYLLQTLLILEQSNTAVIADVFVTREAKVCLFRGNPNTSPAY